MKFSNNLPIYLQIQDYIKSKIIVGEMKAGDKLPSVREIAAELKVNPNTIQRSYAELEREGLVFTQRGIGTYVTEDKDRIIELKSTLGKVIFNHFMDDMKAIGFSIKDIQALIYQREREES